MVSSAIKVTVCPVKLFFGVTYGITLLIYPEIRGKNAALMVDQISSVTAALMSTSHTYK